jgi:hypothetical protein
MLYILAYNYNEERVLGAYLAKKDNQLYSFSGETCMCEELKSFFGFYYKKLKCCRKKTITGIYLYFLSFIGFELRSKIVNSKSQHLLYLDDCAYLLVI